jgi:hypothetical protein
MSTLRNAISHTLVQPLYWVKIWIQLLLLFSLLRSPNTSTLYMFIP